MAEWRAGVQRERAEASSLEPSGVCFECRRIVAAANLVKRASDGMRLCPPCFARESK
jgi:hypothetical protein